MGVPEIKYGDSLCFIMHMATGLWLSYQAPDVKSTRLGPLKRRVNHSCILYIYSDSAGIISLHYYTVSTFCLLVLDMMTWPVNTNSISSTFLWLHKYNITFSGYCFSRWMSLIRPLSSHFCLDFCQACLHAEGHMDDGFTLQRCQHEESRAARIIRNTTRLFSHFIRYWAIPHFLLHYSMWRELFNACHKPLKNLKTFHFQTWTFRRHAIHLNVVNYEAILLTIMGYI